MWTVKVRYSLLLLVLVLSVVQILWFNLQSWHGGETEEGILPYRVKNSVRNKNSFTPTISRPPQPSSPSPTPPPPPLLVEKRRLFTAGYDAKTDLWVADGNTYWAWGSQTEEWFQRLFDDANNQSTSCASDSTAYMMMRQEWGIGSRVRDTMDMMLKAMSLGLPVVHKGPDHCVMRDDRDNDDYMICLFQKFSSCQGTVPFPEITCGIIPCPPYIHRRELVGHDWEAFLRPWWKSMQDTDTDTHTHTHTHLRMFNANGPISARGSQHEPHLDEMLEVFRSLLLRSTFVPTQEIETRIRHMEEHFSPRDHQPMIAVHVRRGDKVWNDNVEYGSMAHEDMRTHTPIQTLKHVHALVRAVERLSGMRFRSIFLLSDEPSVYGDDAKSFLASALQEQNVMVYSDDEFVRKHFAADNTEVQTKGHEALDNRLHQELDMQIVATMYFLARHASYLVGYGKSGVSQIIAQLLGSTHRMSPSVLSLFEDDAVLLQHLDETKDFQIDYI